MKIYIAGPFFADQELKELKYMISLVRQAYPKADLFIPMEHEIPNAWDLPNHIWAKHVFDMDVKAIDKCDMVITMYTGHYSDTGTAWEIGYAFAKGIPVVGYIPNWANEKDMSLMILNSFHGILVEDDESVATIKTIKNIIKNHNQK